MKIRISNISPRHGRMLTISEILERPCSAVAPVEVYEYDTWRFVVVDGHHRIARCLLAGKSTVEAVVIPNEEGDSVSSLLETWEERNRAWTWKRFLGEMVPGMGNDDTIRVSISPGGFLWRLELLCSWCSDTGLLSKGEHWSMNHQTEGTCGEIREIPGVFEDCPWPITGDACSHCGGDPGNGAGGYSGCCDALVERVEQWETNAARAMAWAAAKKVGRRELVNLTPHPVCLYKEEGDPLPVEIPVGGEPARVEVVRKQMGVINGLPRFREVGAVVRGLPEPSPGRTYIVSQRVAAAAKDRMDLVFPDDLVREHGVVVGCRAFGVAW